MPDPKPKPTIYQFSLGDEVGRSLLRSGSIFTFNVYQRILLKLRKLAIVQEAWNNQEALDLLGQDKTPRAIIITDAGIIDPDNSNVSEKVVEYARNGGTVILGVEFPGNTNATVLDEYMTKVWGLPWTTHSYNYLDCVINTAASGPAKNTPNDRQWMNGLQALYTEKCVYIDNVAPDACWYLPTADPYYLHEYENEEKWRAAAAKMTQTPVAFAPVGKGYLGYVGE
ncbi:hypothetical protein MGN70_012521 [Eutypa lata]|uniref:Putative transcription factor protein n=1 Tax=Eutypa lata (strain UCR-EL1) TaxID=1287681 RepID=M7SXW3_EUTLA|nr:putative transcription factor protein [Eutypa lata UCREL1]KAI1245629.1 hypothetical protein MGN70_012521 [Eutypa lata]